MIWWLTLGGFLVGCAIAYLMAPSHDEEEEK
jgi:hypothetical protein